MDFANFEKAVKRLGSEIVRRARLNLGVVRQRQGYRSTWKKSGKKWTPTSTKIVRSKRNSIASGKLRDSIRYQMSGLNVGLYYEKYGDYVQSGRKGKSKMAPPIAMRSYTKMKRLKPRDMKTGKFIKATESNMNSMAFMINRSMSYYGVPAYPFMDKAIEESYEKELQNLLEAFKKDLADGIDN
jgi:hypothetical protein